MADRVAVPANSYIGLGLKRGALGHLYSKSEAYSEFCLSGVNAGYLSEQHFEERLTAAMAYTFAEMKFINSGTRYKYADLMVVCVGELCSIVMSNTRRCTTTDLCRRRYIRTVMMYLVNYYTTNDPPTVYMNDDERLTDVVEFFGRIYPDFANNYDGSVHNVNIFVRLAENFARKGGVKGTHEGQNERHPLLDDDVAGTSWTLTKCVEVVKERVSTNDFRYSIDFLHLLIYCHAYISLDVMERRPSLHMNLVYSSMIAICKRGAITDSKLEKIIATIKTELPGKVINLEEGLLQRIWAEFGNDMSSDIMRYSVTKITANLPNEALGLRLMLQQCKWSGLLAFRTIEEAMIHNREFPWAALISLVPYNDEHTRFQNARVAVGNNPYYGFQSDIGLAKSTNFPNLAAVCQQLLIAAQQQNSLKKAQSFKRNFMHEDVIRATIANYVAGLVNEVNYQNLVQENPAVAEVNLVDAHPDLAEPVYEEPDVEQPAALPTGDPLDCGDEEEDGGGDEDDGAGAGAGGGN